MGGASYPMMNRGRADSNVEADRDVSYEYRRRMGSYIREHRLKHGLKQAELGKLLGLTHTSISNFELGYGTLHHEHFATMADIFGIPQPEMGKMLLRYSNPWVYKMIYGEDKAGTIHADLTAMEAASPAGKWKAGGGRA
jgi:transcriptional regulator with XRE-family HTH domain